MVCEMHNVQCTMHNMKSRIVFFIVLFCFFRQKDIRTYFFLDIMVLLLLRKISTLKTDFYLLCSFFLIVRQENMIFYFFKDRITKEHKLFFVHLLGALYFVIMFLCLLIYISRLWRSFWMVV